MLNAANRLHGLKLRITPPTLTSTVVVVNRDVVGSVKQLLLDYVNVDHLDRIREESGGDSKDSEIPIGNGLHFDGIGRVNPMFCLSRMLCQVS